MLLDCGVGEDSWESLGLQGDPTNPFWRRSVLGVLWKEWCKGWHSSTLATWCEELTHLKRPWCWERLRARGEGDDGGWDGWMASWLNGQGFGWTLGIGDGQGGLACCGSWGHKESDMTEWLNWDWVAHLCLTLCDPMGCSMSGFPVLYHLLELSQSHVHWVSDVIQPSHPLLSPFSVAFNFSQH